MGLLPEWSGEAREEWRGDARRDEETQDSGLRTQDPGLRRGRTGGRKESGVRRGETRKEGDDTVSISIV